MIVLALESSTTVASVAICQESSSPETSQVLATESSSSQRTHSEFLNPAIERCLLKSSLTLADVDLFACGIGPGSFTGLRVASSIAKTFSLTFQKPLVAMDSLTLLMQTARMQGETTRDVICMINAHKNMNYTARFSGTEMKLAPAALTIPEINAMNWTAESPVLCLGDGYKAYEKLFSQDFHRGIHRNPDCSDYPLASTLARLAPDLLRQNQTIEWNLLKPLYIRASEAEENQRVKSR
jgi:tRNA threonylcarbamoyladenosine biosynthesis protein TsaB